MSKGKVEEALRSIANLPGIQERAYLIAQMAGQIGPGLKTRGSLEPARTGALPVTAFSPGTGPGADERAL
ncbi:MAG TPA: hypothetical protein VHH35_04495 [Pyrinomonadaceae bacterium]|nr:hypothetical protein [Pyrinomonadaceae bacterium]